MAVPKPSALARASASDEAWLPLAPSAKIKGLLAKLAITCTEELLWHLPIRYEDRTQITPLAQAQPGFAQQFQVVVTEAAVKSQRRRELYALVTDDSGASVVRFFHFYPSQLKVWRAGQLLRIFGEPREGRHGLEFVHPVYSVCQATTVLPEKLTPIYSTTTGLNQATLSKFIGQARQAIVVEELIDEQWRAQFDLMPIAQALEILHQPKSEHMAEACELFLHAQRRIKFDELLAYQLAYKSLAQKKRILSAYAIPPSTRLVKQLFALLPFSLTLEQQKCSTEIAEDLSQTKPMLRLLQGDVGSGKTVVAFVAALQVIEAGFSVAFMAPTETLAVQHYLSSVQWLSPLGVQVILLTGQQTQKQKKAQQALLAQTPYLVIGTHALIQKHVHFDQLALAIIDEQHRFGVKQRIRLKQSDNRAHLLMMSATPIPRSIAMTFYADLDLSVIKQLPGGRLPIVTKLLQNDKRERVVQGMAEQLKLKRQAYWVCPLIEESEKIDLQTATCTHAWLQAQLPDYTVHLMHGRMTPQEKAQIMADFQSGTIDVLVATTVIEVGIDVSNATFMVIENAERFGLAQLHQLRGRVGRSSHASVCVLLYSAPLTATASARLKAIYHSQDGFALAEQDLAIRGPGEFIGSRQSGVPSLRYADLIADSVLLAQSKALSEEFLQAEQAQAQKHIKRWLGQRMEHIFG